MWCHLCTQDYPNFEDFRNHIMQMHRNVSELCTDNSDSEESEHDNDDILAVDDENAALNVSEEYYDSDHNIDAEHESDHIPASENKSELSMTTYNNLPGKRHDDEDKSSTLNTLRKSRQWSDKENKSDIKENISKKSPKKLTLSSILKKQVKKKKKKVVIGKKVTPKRRVAAVSFQEDISEHSDCNEMDHIKSSFNGDNNVKSQSVVPVNNYVNSQPISNNSVFLINPYTGQGVNNNCIMGSQSAVQQSVYVVNTAITNSTTIKTEKGFDFHSKNIVNWLTKHKELCKNIQYPLPSSLFIQVQAVLTGIFNHYSSTSVSEETTAVMKVYEELDCMIHKHVNSINNALSVL